MRLPSVKSLEAVTTAPVTLRRCLEKYRDGHVSLRFTMERADELMNGYGVEYIRHSLDGCRVVYGLDYVSMGDTYSTTLVYDHRNDRFIVGSWGSMVEAASESTYL